MKEIIKDLGNLCNEYINYVEDFGNECAYTDAIVESIIRKLAIIKDGYVSEL